MPGPAVVTGAAGGIGGKMAGALVDDGYTVAALDLDEGRLGALADEIGSERLWTSRLDVTDAVAVREAFARIARELGPPTVLVNIAGTNRVIPLLETSEEDWDHLIDLNLKGTFLCCQAVVPHMLEQGHGRIVNMSSIFGIRGQESEAVYSAAKAGIIGLTRALAREFARDDITVNALAPVMTLTPRVAGLPEEFKDLQLSRIPMGRYGTVEDLVATVRFLLSEGGSFYTGQTFSANGGDTMP